MNITHIVAFYPTLIEASVLDLPRTTDQSHEEYLKQEIIDMNELTDAERMNGGREEREPLERYKWACFLPSCTLVFFFSYYNIRLQQTFEL